VSAEIEIDRFVCIGSGTCVRLAPGAFELDGEGVAVTLDPVTSDIDELRMAERSCPTAAIFIDAADKEEGDV
jgi:ferredoxin